MRTHCTAYPAARGFWRGHVTAIRHVGTSTMLVRSQVVRAEYHLAIFGNEDLVLPREPIGKSVFSAQISWQRVCVTRANYGFENRPNSITIARLRRTNGWHLSMLAHSHKNVERPRNPLDSRTPRSRRMVRGNPALSHKTKARKSLSRAKPRGQWRPLVC